MEEHLSRVDRDDGTHDASAQSEGHPVRRERRPVEERRIAILTDDRFATRDARLAHALIRYGREQVVAVIDSRLAGGTAAHVLGNVDRFFDIPIVSSLSDALALPESPNELVLGVATVGGALPEAWHPLILQALRHGLDVVSGLHTLLADDPVIAAAARASGSHVVDLGRPPCLPVCAGGMPRTPGKRVILTVGTVAAAGKTTAAIELAAAARAAGFDAAMVPTGPSGVLVEGWGAAVDRVPADLLPGAVEWAVAQGESRAEWLVVEGQGTIGDPAQSAIAVGLIHGAAPDAMVMVHELEAPEPLALPLPQLIAIHESVAALARPSRVVAIAVNSGAVGDPRAARLAIEEVTSQTGLPADDPARFGGERLWHAVEAAVEEASRA